MKRLALAFSIGFIVLGGLLYYGSVQLQKAFHAQGPLGVSKILDIPGGSSLAHISTLLEEQGIIQSAFVFTWMIRLKGQAQSLKAGEYEFLPGASSEQVMTKLVSGQVYLHKYTLAEGLTTQEALAQIKAHEKLTGEVTQLPPEGSLMPETYLFAKGYKRQTLIHRMVQAQKKFLEALWGKRPFDLVVQTPGEALILASIIEKETALPLERSLISAVFTNRLRKGMPLQMDPTIRYALHKDKGKPLNEALTRTELQYDSPYNTYRYKGLPPTPICNPGRASLRAVFTPDPSNVLYFVADGSGGHVFSSTLKEHRRNHRKWRRIRAEKRRAQAVKAQE